MITNYTDLKAVIVAKLTALQIGGADAFVAVYNVNPTKPTGYPCAAVLENEGEGEVIDTGRNQRIMEFKIKLIQQMGEGTTPAQASVIRLKITDAVMKMFDQDPQLVVDSVDSVIIAEVAPITFEEIIKDRTIFESEFILQCKVLTNSYA